MRSARLRARDALPLQAVGRVAPAALVAARAVHVELAPAAPPRHGGGHRALSEIGEAQPGETVADEGPPHEGVVLPGPRDEPGTPARRPVELIEGAERRLVARLADDDAALGALAHAPPGVLLQAGEHRVQVGREVDDERREHRLDVRPAAVPGVVELRGRFLGRELGVDLEQDGPALPRELR